MELKELIEKADNIRESYAEVNRNRGKKTWDAIDYAHGLVGDVGDLMKLLTAYFDYHKDFRDSKNVLHKKISHELADCLWSVAAIANELGIDLEREFMINLEYLNQKLKEELLNER